MDFTQLMEGEEIITQSDNSTITLTNYRLRQQSREWGRSYTASIMLENVSSIVIRYSSATILVVIAVLCILGAVFAAMSREKDIAPLGFGVALVFFLAYFLTRKRTFSISSKGGAGILFPSCEE